MPRGVAMPLFSIVIPACDAAGTIGRTLASLTAQSRRDWEAIVIDDGSRDGTVAIVERRARADGRIGLIRQPNAGPGAARNAGIAIARGAWTIFLDADDTLGRHHLARMHDCLRLHARADAACCGFVRRDAGGRVVTRSAAPRLDRDPVAACRDRPPTALHALVVRTARLRETGGFDPAWETNEDWDLWWRLAGAGTRFAVTRRVRVDYHVRAGSLTRNGPAMLRDTLAMLARTRPPDPARAAMIALMWNAGGMIAAGQDMAGLTAALPCPVGTLDHAAAAEALIEGLVLGSGAPATELAPVWSRYGARLDRFLHDLRRIGLPHAAADGLARRIEREVIRNGRFRRSRRIGASLGVMLSPRLLWRGIDPVAGVERVVIKVPLVRPRSLLMIDARLTRRLGGVAIGRLLIGRIVAAPARLIGRSP